MIGGTYIKSIGSPTIVLVFMIILKIIFDLTYHISKHKKLQNNKINYNLVH